MATATNDYSLYEEILQETRDDAGVCHRDTAVAELAEILLADPDRVSEFAENYAAAVASKFDKQRAAETTGRQLSFTEDTWWICGDAERVQSIDMRTAHLDSWFTIQRQQFVAQSAVFAAKSEGYDELRPVMVEHGYTLWEAKQYLDEQIA